MTSWSGRRVLVTGGAGFIGSHLVAELVKRGASVAVLDNLSTGREAALESVLADIEFVRGSTLDLAALRELTRGADVVFHLAAVLGVRRTWEEPIRVIHENVMGTQNVLRAACDAGVPRVVHASSSEVYGDGEPPYSEAETPAAPRTGYATAKLLEEKLAEAFHREEGLQVSSLRYFNVYGDGQASSAYGFVAAIFCQRVQQGLPPVVFGDGEQTRDFTYVDDVVEATLLSADRAGPCDVLNVGTGIETRIKRLARAIIRASGAPLYPVYEPARDDEVRRRAAETTHVRETLGWQPRWTLEQGIAQTVRRAKLLAPAPAAQRADT